MIAGDHLLPGITPAVGLYPEARPDPLGDYLQSLERTVRLSPRLALPGHGEPIGEPVTRAQELIEHHRNRLDATAALEVRQPGALAVTHPGHLREDDANVALDQIMAACTTWAARRPRGAGRY